MGGGGGGGSDSPLTTDRRLEEQVKWIQGATSGSPEWKTAERRREGRFCLAHKAGTLFPTTAATETPATTAVFVSSVYERARARARLCVSPSSDLCRRRSLIVCLLLIFVPREGGGGTRAMAFSAREPGAPSD